MRIPAAIAVAAIAIACPVPPADAQRVSRCVDANGHVYLTQGGPPDGVTCVESSQKDAPEKSRPSVSTPRRSQPDEGSVAPRIAHTRGSREIGRSQRPGVAPQDAWTCPAAQPIKGNFTTYSGERCIYHAPGGKFYGKTSPERCYASGDDAEQDGCRASKR